MTTMDMEEDLNETMDSVTTMELSAASTTIDPSVVQSRILQSTSLQKEETMQDGSDQPVFPRLSAAQASGKKIEYRRVRCPAHRYTPLREHWEQILTPLVEYLKLQVRFLNTEGHNCVLVVIMSLCRGRCEPIHGMYTVLFLELQTLREASVV